MSDSRYNLWYNFNGYILSAFNMFDLMLFSPPLFNGPAHALIYGNLLIHNRLTYLHSDSITGPHWQSANQVIFVSKLNIKLMVTLLSQIVISFLIDSLRH